MRENAKISLQILNFFSRIISKHHNFFLEYISKRCDNWTLDIPFLFNSWQSEQLWPRNKSYTETSEVYFFVQFVIFTVFLIITFLYLGQSWSNFQELYRKYISKVQLQDILEVYLWKKVMMFKYFTKFPILFFAIYLKTFLGLDF